MRIFKKVLFLFLIGIMLSLYSCSFIYGTCGDIENIPIALINISKIKHINIHKSNINEENPITRSQYGGFYIDFETETLAYQSVIKPFSIFPSAYAFSCGESSIVLREVYPVSIKIITLNDLDEVTKSGDLANQYFILPFRTTNTEKTLFDVKDVQNNTFSVYPSEFLFFLQFRIHTSLTPYPENIQFRIEMTLNTGEVWIEETSIVVTE